MNADTLRKIWNFLNRPLFVKQSPSETRLHQVQHLERCWSQIHYLERCWSKKYSPPQ